MRAGTRLVRRVRVTHQRRQRLGRIVGGAGAVVASLFWGVLVLAVVSLLIEPTDFERFVLIFAIPMGVLASVLFVVCLIDVVVLARRVDVGNPWRVASLHVLMTVVLLWMRGSLLVAAIPASIAVSQIIAIRLFQMTPSQASSHR
jgi:hypothetical protein